MKKDRISQTATYIGLIINILIIFTSSVAIWGFSSINDKQDNIVSLCQLRSDILYANLALRNAAISPSEVVMENELDKMLVTRASANKIYDKLSASKLSSYQKTLLNEMKADRPSYRQSQLTVVDSIRKHKSNEICKLKAAEIWVKMSYYNTLMDRYVQRVDTMMVDINTNIIDLYSKMRIFIIISTSVVTILSLVMIRLFYRFYYTKED